MRHSGCSDLNLRIASMLSFVSLISILSMLTRLDNCRSVASVILDEFAERWTTWRPSRLSRNAIRSKLERLKEKKLCPNDAIALASRSDNSFAPCESTIFISLNWTSSSGFHSLIGKTQLPSSVHQLRCRFFAWILTDRFKLSIKRKPDRQSRIDGLQRT